MLVKKLIQLERSELTFHRHMALTQRALQNFEDAVQCVKGRLQWAVGVLLQRCTRKRRSQQEPMQQQQQEEAAGG